LFVPDNEINEEIFNNLTSDDLKELIPVLGVRKQFEAKFREYIAIIQVYSAFFLTVAIGNCMVKLVPPVNFCSDENIQTIIGTKLKDFLNYRIDYNSIS
jgi:hypothetical protein